MSIAIALDHIRELIQNTDAKSTAVAFTAVAAGWWTVVSTVSLRYRRIGNAPQPLRPRIAYMKQPRDR
jgi:hypothetical protein